MNISIVRPQVKDKKEICNLFKSTIKDAFEQEGILHLHKDINKEIKKQFDRLNQDFQSQGRRVYYLIARNNSQIVGTIAQTQPDSIIKNNLKINLANIAVIASVYVLPHFQGKGIGSLLFDSMLKHLKQKNINEFVMDSGYKKAQNFWIKKVGKPTVLLKDYWNKDSDHMIWQVKSKDL